MISLENIENEYGRDTKGVKQYINESNMNNGIYYLGGKLPIKKRDLVNKKIIENVKQMLHKENIIDENFKEYRKLYYGILTRT